VAGWDAPWFRIAGEGIVQGSPVVMDQIANLLGTLKSNPDSRRHIVSTWNRADVDRMILPPTHPLLQFYVANDTLSLQLYQRSADVFLGIRLTLQVVRS